MEDVKKEKDTKTDETLMDDRFERLTKALRPGYSVAIHRIRPSWCAGFLERVEISDEDSIDLTYIVDTWGGASFNLRVCDEHGIYRGGAAINCASYPPKVRGKRITREGIEGGDDLPEGVRYVNQPQAIQRQPMAQGGAGGGAGGIGAGNVMETVINTIKSLKSMQNEDLSLLREALGSTQIQPKVVGDTIDGVMDTVRKYKELEAVFGGATQQLEKNTEDGNAQFFGVIKDVLQALAPRPAAAFPVQAVPMAQAQPQLVRNPSPLPQTIAQTPGQQIGVDDIFPVLQKLDPSQLSEAFYGLLGAMPMEKREKTLELIFTRLGIQDDIISAEEEDEEPES